MDLKKRQQVRHMNQYLPGFVGGTPWNWNSNRFDYSMAPFNNNVGPYAIGQMPPTYENIEAITNQPTDYGIKKAQDIPITIGTTENTPKSNKIGADKASNIATSAVSFAGSTMNAFSGVKGVNEIMADGGIGVGTGGGFDYQRYNGVDSEREYSELSRQNTSNTLGAMGSGAALGASIGSLAGPWGTVIGGAAGAIVGLGTGLFGGASRKRRLERKIFAANQQIQAANLYSKSSSYSDYLTQQYNQKHQNTQDDLLYGAKEGKDMFTLLPGFVNGVNVYTSYGQGPGEANSRVAFGETIYSPTKGTANIVKNGKLNQDTNLSFLEDSDVVFGNHINWLTGRTFRDDALPFAAVLERLKG